MEKLSHFVVVIFVNMIDKYVNVLIVHKNIKDIH